MIRAFWIVGISIALIAFSGFIVLCLVALVIHRHLNLTGWTMLVLSAYSVYFFFGRLHSAIKYGDPTKDMNHRNAV